MSRTLRNLMIPLSILAGGVAVLGCGNDSGTTTTVAAAAPGNAVTIDMNEFSYNPQDAIATAGAVTITTRNVGQVVHELVLARTNAAPGKLPTLPDGSVDEDTLEAQGRAPGEVSETDAGATRKATIQLPAGHYVMYCNVPGHYVAGMYGTLIVK